MSVKTHEPVCLDSAMDKFFWGDHFLGDQVQGEWRGAGTGSVAVVDGQIGGIARITTGAVTNDTYYIDWNNSRILHVDKKVTIEIRAKLETASNIQIQYRLMFDVTNLISFWFNSGAHASYRLYVRDDGATTNVDSGVAPDTDYHVFRIEAFPTGEVHFYIDGVECSNSPVTTNIPADAGDYLQPYLAVTTLEDATKYVDFDYVVVRQDR